MTGVKCFERLNLNGDEIANWGRKTNCRERSVQMFFIFSWRFKLDPFRIAEELAAVPRTSEEEKRKRATGVHTSAMSLVTALNTSERRGWKVTTMGCIVRPVLMRPERPLTPQARSILGRDTKRKVGGKEKKMRVKEPDTRARWRDDDAHSGTGH
jgi:hypothetical protein